MTNVEVARVFWEIADLLELKGENPFKVRAYRRAAERIEGLDEDIEVLSREGRLNTLEGIGEAISRKTQELLDTGKLGYLEKLKEEVPSGLLVLIAIPGVGPKTAAAIYRGLGITSVEDLKAACERREVRKLPGMGAKTELNILHGIELMKERASRFPIGTAYPLAWEFVERLGRLSVVEQVSLAGSLRRMKETIGDIDIVVGSSDAGRVMELVAEFPYIREIKEQGDTRMSLILMEGIGVDLWVVNPRDFVTALHHSTGSKAHNVRLRSRAKEMGLKINEYGIWKATSAGEEEIPVESEADIYSVLGLSYIPPELREDRGEVEAAASGHLPKLLELTSIRGDLHVHSSASDGTASIAQIAEAAKRRGYSYVAICDHSRSLGIARGLSEDRLLRQIEEIRKLNEQLTDIRILAGSEIDIKKDGSLDFPDTILAQLDIVVASVHSAFRQDMNTMTDRVMAALENEHVDILGHPTGRLLGSREPYAIDIDRVIEVAAATGTALEINSYPERLDLNDINARKAKEAGVKLAIDTDSHSLGQLGYMSYGVAVARRGWIESADVINAWNIEDLLSWIGKGKPRR